MRLFSIIIIIIFVSCKHSCPKTEEEWESLLKENSLNGILNIKFFSGNLDIMWNGKIENANLPIENNDALEKLPKEFRSDAHVRDTVIDNLKLVYIKSINGSKVLFSKEYGIVETEIIESLKEFLGEKIKIGMNKTDFIQLYFKKYNSCFDEINQVSFPYGMNNNGLTFEFKDHKLIKVSMINYPD